MSQLIADHIGYSQEAKLCTIEYDTQEKFLVIC